MPPDAKRTAVAEKPAQTQGPTAPPIQGQTALATAPPPPPVDNSIRGLLERAKPKLAEVLPRHLSADRLVRVTIACINKTPDLLECTRESLLNAVMIAAQLGLEPTGVLGSAYLVPFNVKIKTKDAKGITHERWEKQATLIPGYRGLIDLARRSGQIESIEAHVVHSNDRFTCRYGLDPVLDHEPCWTGEPGNVIAVYAVAKLKDGGKQIEVMTKAQVDRIRAGSKSKGNTWDEHFDEMARKTVIRRIAKYLPLSPEMADALSALDDVEGLEKEPIEAAPPPKGVDGLKTLLSAKDTTVDVPPHDPVTGEVKDEPPAANDAVNPNVKKIDPETARQHHAEDFGPTAEEEREADELAAEFGSGA